MQKNHMKRLKKEILEDNQMPTPSTSSSTSDPTRSTSSSTRDLTPSTPSNTTRSNDTYVYGVGMLAVLVIGVCGFFAYNTSQAENKKQVNKKQDQPPKRRHIL